MEQTPENNAMVRGRQQMFYWIKASNFLVPTTIWLQNVFTRHAFSLHFGFNISTKLCHKIYLLFIVWCELSETNRVEDYNKYYSKAWSIFCMWLQYMDRVCWQSKGLWVKPSANRALGRVIGASTPWKWVFCQLPIKFYMEQLNLIFMLNVKNIVSTTKWNDKTKNKKLLAC